MPPRILHVDSGEDWRGGQRQLLLLARGLRDRGYEPLVVATPGSALVQRLRRAGLATSAVAMRGDWDPVAARRVRTLARTWNAEIVHAHDPRAHAIALFALLDRPHVPLVVTRRVSQPPRGIRRQYASRVARFLVPSRAVGDSLLAAGVAEDRVDVVHPGIPKPVVHHRRDWRAECGWPRDTVLCGVIGSTAPPGADLLVDIAERLTTRARQRVRLVLFGGSTTGPERIAGVDAVRVGFVDDIHPALAGVELLLHLTTADGLGTAVIDAMALGVPPVAFASPGVHDLIAPGHSGILIPNADVDEMAAAASRLVSSSSARRFLATRGPEQAARFTVDTMIDRVERAYRFASRRIAPP